MESTTAESPAPEVEKPEGDPQMPDEGQDPGGDPPTAPENPETDDERVERTEEDLDKIS
jgi:hypothetical protein